VGSAVGVIGINSFSGSTFAAHMMTKGFSVIGFARSLDTSKAFLPHLNSAQPLQGKVKIHRANLVTDSDLICEVIFDQEVKVIVNFASQSMVAESWNAPEDWYDTNVSGIAKLVHRLSKYRSPKIERYIQFSTPEVYGSTKGLLKENWNFNPNTPYAISRAASDFHIRAMFNAFGFPAIFTRTSNIYGRHQRLYRLIPKLVVTALKGETFNLHGGGGSLRSFIHSKDVAKALEEIILKGSIGETYHISGNDFISIRNLTCKVLELMSIDFDEFVRIVDDRPGKDQAYLLDSSKIRSELGWKDEVSLNKGITDVISWISNSWEDLKDQSLDYVHAR